MFLALDEKTQFHAKLDFAIHYFLQIRETAITDRIDDAVVCVYLLIAFWLLYYYRAFLSRYSGFLKLSLWAGIVGVVSVVLDALTNRMEIAREILLQFGVPRPETRFYLRDIRMYMPVLEEGTKTAAIALATCALYRVRIQLRQRRN